MAKRSNIGLLLWLSLSPCILIAEPVLKVSTGFDISSGDYGESKDTEILYFPSSVKYSAYPWAFKLSVPFLTINGPSNLVGGADGAEVIDGASSEIRRSSGMGDLFLQANFSLDSLWKTNTYIDLIGKVKIPTASESDGLGTGETDVQIHLDFARVYDEYTPFATLGIKLPGNSSSTSYNNQLLGSLGVDNKLNEKTNLGVIYDYRDASTDTSVIHSEALLYVNRKINPKLSINTYLVAGFSEASPDWGAGVQASWIVE